MKHAVPDEAVLPMDRDAVRSYLVGKERHEVWEKRGKKCFSCGSCVLVCPTCYCFDVQDELDLSLEKGERVRSWDGCTIENFATAAGGIISGKRRGQDTPQALPEAKVPVQRFGLPGCVGCGRCKKACVPDIAFPVDILAK